MSTVRLSPDYKILDLAKVKGHRGQVLETICLGHSFTKKKKIIIIANVYMGHMVSEG